jgi:hypothetical protein
VRTGKLGLALTLASFLLGFSASPAFALPSLELELSNEPTALPRTDEGMFYTATVKNAASANPAVGDPLTCLGTLEDGADWFGDPKPTFTYRWLREGQTITDAEERVYTTTAEDTGASVQCVLTSANDPDGAETFYAPIVSSWASTPVVIEPQPASAPPHGSSRPAVSGGAAWSAATATATITDKSNVLTNVISTEGTGDLAAGSKVVTGVTTSFGTFLEGGTENPSENPQQIVTGEGIPAETWILNVLSPTEFELSQPATKTESNVALKAGPLPLKHAQEVVGPGIPAGAKVTAVNGQTLTLSAAATESKSNATIASVVTRTCEPPAGWSADTPITWSFRWLRNGKPIAGATSVTYTAQKDDVEPPAVLQCEATATDQEGHKAVAISNIGDTNPSPPNPYSFPVGADPTISASNDTAGPVTLEVALPPGVELVYGAFDPATFAKEGIQAPAPPDGWSCSIQQPSEAEAGKVTCTRSDTLPPGASYPPILVAAQLAADSPESGTAVATVSGGGALDSASDEASYEFLPGPGFPFGMLAGSFEAGVFDPAGKDDTRAGAHPFRGYSTFGFNVHQTVGKTILPSGRLKDIVVDVPRGFVGNALATPDLCGSIEEVIRGECPAGSIVGGIDVFTYADHAPLENFYPDGSVEGIFVDIPIYSVEPEFGQPAQFAFSANVDKQSGTPYTFVPELRPDEGYAVSFRTAPILTLPPLYGSNVDLCAFGAKTGIAGSGNEAVVKFAGCRKPTEAAANPVPLITNPTRCSGPPPTSRLRIDSWENPEDVKTYDFTSPQITDCDQVFFEPEAELTPSNTQADTPTGLEVELTMPTDGLLDPTGVSQANLNTAEVTFPKGMTINPSAANGLGACTPEQIQLKTNAEAKCPESSKVGTIEIDTPLIRETLKGNVYVAAQRDNPFDATLGLYMVFSSKRDGVTIKIAGQAKPDPATGQLVTTFTENPEAPFSRVALKFNDGPRAPLINPPKCGTYKIHAEFSPWSAVNPANPTPDEIVSQDDTYRVNRGPGGGPCPRGDLVPKLRAGVQDNQAGSSSPFVLRLSRDDGTQRFTAADVTMPPGLVASLKGVPYCPESALAGISAAELTGRSELASPACPAASRIGTITAGAGAGLNPFYVDTGKAYLAGPYKGAPLSLALVTPAVAGPIDLGTVLTRAAVYIKPETATVTVKSDPIPTALHDFALDVRDIRVAVDRPNFIVAPTNCEPMQVTANVKGDEGGAVTVADRFQVGGCEKLRFGPKIYTRLFGGTLRGAHPRLRATLTARPGETNIARAVVSLPRSEFLDQAHIRTICTRVQYAANACPQGAIYGYAKAFTPLLDHPVEGPVYLRSSDNKLPDVVVSLKGPATQPIGVDLVGRVDSIGGGIRTTFDVVPDAPVSKFILTMQGGKKGLLVNSRNICGRKYHSSVELTAQNGKEISLEPRMRAACKKQSKGGKKARGKGGGEARARGGR